LKNLGRLTYVRFRNKLFTMWSLAPRPTPNLED